MGTAIEVSGLTKYYGDPSTGRRAELAKASGRALLAVDHVSFEVKAGEVFGFLGPNGAGKTSTIRMLTGLSQPTAGSARVLGHDLHTELVRIKKAVGVVPESSNLYDELTARDNLIFMSQLYGVPRRQRGQRADQLLRQFRLWEKREVAFAKLSRGMKRALTVAAALVHRPRLLFLDEPTTGLDVLSAHSLRALIERLQEAGVTIFLTTHYLEEAERLCDQVALIVKGRIVALDTVDGLKAQVQGPAAVEVIMASAEGQEERQRFVGDDVAAAARKALAAAKGRQVMALNTIRPTLEDAFIELTGLSAEVMRAEKGNQ